MISAKSSDTTQIPDVVNAGLGIFTISPLKNDDSLAQPGEAKFTFKSTKGYVKEIIVRFEEAPLKEIIISEIENNDFGAIFQNKLTDYFFINTNPDESKYTFGIDVIEGDKEGIELYDWEKGNIEGNPDFAYSIKGLKVGEYKFRFYVVGYENICSNEYTLEVKEPYSSDYIKSQIVSQKYVYNTSTVSFEVEFISDTKFNFTYSNYGTPVSKEIDYRITTGNIIIDNDVNLGTNLYFTNMKSGEIKFDDDFTNIYLTLAYNEFEGTPFYAIYSFKKYIDPSALVEDLSSYLVNKTFVSNDFTLYVVSENSAKWAKVKLSFTSTSGQMYLTYKNDKSIDVYLATITFDYKYEKSGTYLSLSNVVTDNENYSINASSGGYFNQYSLELEFKITDKYGDNTIEFSI